MASIEVNGTIVTPPKVVIPTVVVEPLTDKEVFVKLEHLQSNINTLTTLCTILCVILLFFFVVQALAVVIQLIRRCSKKNLEEEAEKAKKSGKSDKKSGKSSKKSKSKKSKTKKGKSKKSKSKSKNSKTSSSKSSAKKSAKVLKATNPPQQPPPELPSSKLSATEKKPEASGGKKSAESASKPLPPPSLIKLQPQDPLLSVSNAQLSAEKPTVAQIGKEFNIMHNLEAGKLKALPLPPAIAAAIDPARKIPEATTPPQQPSKPTDAEKDKTDETSASLKYEKQFPDVTTPPQVHTPKQIEADEVKVDGMPSGSESVRKVADVSSPPPLMSGPKPNTDSLMLPVSTPPLAPVSPQLPSVQPGSLQPLPTIPKAPIKLDDPPKTN